MQVSVPMRKKMIILDDKTSMPEDRQENRQIPQAAPAQQAAVGETDGLCITSLVLGCCSLIPYIGLVLAILAIVFGFIGLSRVKADGTQGRGMAIAGIVLGACVLLLTAALFLIVMTRLSRMNLFM